MNHYQLKQKHFSVEMGDTNTNVRKLVNVAKLAKIVRKSTKKNLKNESPNQKSLMDPIVNIRSKDSSSSYKQTEIKTDLNFNNLITQ